MEPGAQWPGYDADEDGEWVVVPAEEHSDASDLRDYVNAFEEMSATHIQAEVRRSLAQRRVVTLRATAAAKRPPAPRSVASYTRTICLLVLAFAILTAKKLATNAPPTGGGLPKLPYALPYASLTHAIEDGEVRALELAQDPIETDTWKAIAHLSNHELLESGRVAVRVPAHSVASLLSAVSSNGITFTSPIATPPPPSATPPAIVTLWLEPPSAPPLSPELALALRDAPSSNSSSPSTSSMPWWLVSPSAVLLHEGMGDLLVCAVLGCVALLLAKMVGAALASTTRTRPRAGRSQSQPSSVPPTPEPQAVRPSPPRRSPTPAAALPKKNINDAYPTDLKTVGQIGPILCDRILKTRDCEGPYLEHTFEAQLRGIKGMGDLRVANVMTAFYAPPMTEATGRRAAAAATVPRAPPAPRRLEQEFEAAARSATTPTIVDGLTWKELQRRVGGRGFTKEQMSLMWSAHQKGPLTYNEFRKHCKGRSLGRKTESAMWLQHKLFAAAGVRVVPKRRL